MKAQAAKDAAAGKDPIPVPVPQAVPAAPAPKGSTPAAAAGKRKLDTPAGAGTAAGATAGGEPRPAKKARSSSPLEDGRTVPAFPKLDDELVAGVAPAVATPHMLAELDQLGFVAASLPDSRLVVDPGTLGSFGRTPADVRELSFLMATMAGRALDEYRQLMYPYAEAKNGRGYRRIYYYLKAIVDYHNAASGAFSRSDLLSHTRWAAIRSRPARPAGVLKRRGTDSWTPEDEARFGGGDHYEPTCGTGSGGGPAPASSAGASSSAAGPSRSAK